MAQVIYVDAPKEEEKKKVEFTHYLNTKNGWVNATCEPDTYEKVVYLGKCGLVGDVFAAYSDKCIIIYKGHLNSGEY